MKKQLKNKNTNYYIDTSKYSFNVIETLKEKGGVNSRGYSSKDLYKNCIYYIDPINKEIICSIKDAYITNLIKAFYIEIEPSKRLKKGEIYYYIVMTVSASNSSIKSTTDNYTDFDNATFESGNYFKTEFDAQIALNKIKGIFNDNK